MAKERPIVERQPRGELYEFPVDRAIISPCTGCKNNLPVTPPSERPTERQPADPGRAWPCPKQEFYALREAARRSGDRSRNYSHPVFDQRLKAVNPVWPGLQLEDPDGQKYNQRYAYVFLAFFTDNNSAGGGAFQRSGRGGLNIDTEKIRCRGPFLLASTERQWNFFGNIDQGDTVLGFNAYYYIDGVEFRGYALEAATWQVAHGYSRKLDSNLGRTLSGAARHGGT